MRIEFSERFMLPVEEVYSYFATPADWTRLYGFAGAARDLGAGWFAIGLKRFPFPLVARNTEVVANELVRWTFRGFWRGEGEIRFQSLPDGVLLKGYEEISVRWLSVLSPLIEKLFLEGQFHSVWNHGWRRLRKREAANVGPVHISGAP